MKIAWILGLAALAAPVEPGAVEKALKEATLNLPEAVEKALPQVKDGATIWARIRTEKGRVLYHVGVAQGKESLRLALDAKTGELVTKTAVKKDRSALVAALKLSPAKAVEAALAKVPGKASRVSFEMSKGKPVAEVVVFKEGKLFEVVLDGVSGAVLKVDEEDEDDDGDDDDDDDDDDEDDDD